MANWCHNCVRFTGDPEKVAAAGDLFANMATQQDQRNYELPDYITAEHKSMVEIWTNDEHVHFRSAWSPPLKALMQIADHFGIGFINKYEEPGMFVYGKAYYQNGELDGVRLTRQDASRIGYDEGRELFIFEGKEFDNDEVIIYSMYARKIADFEAAHPLLAENKTRQHPEIKTQIDPGQEEHRKGGLRR